MSKSQQQYRFTERSLEGTFIRVWSVAEGKYVNQNLKDATDIEFDNWIRRFFERHDLTIDESEFHNPTSERLTHWSIESRTRVCKWLSELGLLVTVVDYMEKENA